MHAQTYDYQPYNITS